MSQDELVATLVEALKQAQLFLDVFDTSPPSRKRAETNAAIDEALAAARAYGADLDSRCIEWPASRTKDGYGQMRRGRPWYVHRYVWTVLHGQIPPRMEICHHCDNPPCYKPSHLFLGTRLDNVRDAVRKGRFAGRRHARGPRPPEVGAKIRLAKLGKPNEGSRKYWAARRAAKATADA